MSTIWTVQIAITEEGDETRADAILEGGATQHRGWGRAQRSPQDPDVPRIGAEIAVARALEDLVHKLLETAEDDIADQTGEHTHVHP
jgi:hypothetical protein